MYHQGKSLEVSVLGQKVSTSVQLPQKLYHLVFSPVMHASVSSQPHRWTVQSSSSIFDNLLRDKQLLGLVLILISLNMSEVKHLFIYLRSTFIFVNCMLMAFAQISRFLYFPFNLSFKNQEYLSFLSDMHCRFFFHVVIFCLNCCYSKFVFLFLCNQIYQFLKLHMGFYSQLKKIFPIIMLTEDFTCFLFSYSTYSQSSLVPLDYLQLWFPNTSTAPYGSTEVIQEN